MNAPVAKSIFLIALGATFGMFLIFFVANSIIPSNIWSGMVISQSAVNVEYCEFNNPESFFHQKVNTYSNLAYFFFGMLVILISRFDLKNKPQTSEVSLRNFPELGILLGTVFIYLCFGSSFFHGSLTLLGQRVDMNGTYGITFILLAIVLYHLLFKNDFSNKSKDNILVFLISLVLGFYAIAPLVSSKVLIPLLILAQFVGMIITFAKHPKKRFLTFALLSFLCILWAIKIRTNDVQKIDCNPHGLLQGHAIWHFLTAFSSFLCYGFYRFEKKKQ